MGQKSNDHTWVVVNSKPLCDFDAEHGEAWADGKTARGPWANMCRGCFSVYGLGLGLGRGQKLVTQAELDAPWSGGAA